MAFIDTQIISTWMASPYAVWVLGALSFSESAFFIIPPEVLMLPMSLANPASALWLGVVTTLFSVFGAAFGYFLGQKGGKPLITKLFGEEKTEVVKKLFHKYDTKAIFIAAFSPIPFKVFTVGAGVFDINFTRFIVTSFIGRGTRYMLLAGLIAVFGESIRYFIEHQFDKVLAVGTIALIAIVGFYKVGLPFLEQRVLKQSLKSKVQGWFGKVIH